jgi:hypothetical protein
MKKSILSILAVCATIAVSAQTVAVTQSAASSNSTVGITQEGASAMTLNQLGASGEITINQTASLRFNEITIKQLGNFDGIVIVQEGVNNVITIEQVGAGTAVGGSNAIEINQDINSDNNDVTVTTGGTSNYADIDQLDVINSDITLVQNDINNQTIIMQEGGDNNSIDAFQIGTGVPNTLNIDQYGGSDNRVRVKQDGGGNSFEIDQEGTNNTISGADYSYAIQSGTSNFAKITQFGSTNQINFSQVGTNTNATFMQGGTGNIATLNVQ